MAEMKHSAHAAKRIGKRIGMAALPATIAIVSLLGVANAFPASRATVAGQIMPYGQAQPYSSSPDNFINV